MKRIVAGVLTALILGLLIWSGIRTGPRKPIDPGAVGEVIGSPEPATGAEARLRDLMASARAGDVAAYLACFAEPLRSRLDREVGERGREAFATDLRETAAARKSHALFAPEPEGADSVRITVESVFPDRNERQAYQLVREGADRWLVADVETVRGRSPSSRFGTLATFQGPEGVPVQGDGSAPVAESPRN